MFPRRRCQSRRGRPAGRPTGHRTPRGRGLHSASTASGASGSTMPLVVAGTAPMGVGTFAIPAPDLLRGPFARCRAMVAGELDYAFDLASTASRPGPGRLHRRADPRHGACSTAEATSLRLQACRAHGMLLVLDRRTGLGRTGTMFANLTRRSDPGHPHRAVENARCGAPLSR